MYTVTFYVRNNALGTVSLSNIPQVRSVLPASICARLGIPQSNSVISVYGRIGGLAYDVYLAVA